MFPNSPLYYLESRELYLHVPDLSPVLGDDLLELEVSHHLLFLQFGQLLLKLIPENEKKCYKILLIITNNKISFKKSCLYVLCTVHLGYIIH